MCNPGPPSARFVWGACKDDWSFRHYLPNPDITAGPDHDDPSVFSVTDSAGTFIVYGNTLLDAMVAFLRSPHR